MTSVISYLRRPLAYGADISIREAVVFVITQLSDIQQKPQGLLAGAAIIMFH